MYLLSKYNNILQLFIFPDFNQLATKLECEDTFVIHILMYI